MKYTHKNKNTCSESVSFDLDDDIVTNIKFLGGCQGNLAAISKILNGKSRGEIIEYCKGIICGSKGTSCSDQLAQALESTL